MLAYVLALVIGFGSIALYMAAFFFPEVHRKNDFIWSLVGLFYALVLWVCAGRITGGVLMGQLASVALVAGFGWETLTLRRAIASPEQQTPIESQNELQTKFKDLVSGGNLQGLQQRVTGLFRKAESKATVAAKQVETEVKEVATPPTPEPTVNTPIEVATPPTPEPTVNTPVIEILDKRDTPTEETTPELIPPIPPTPELIEAAQKSASPDTETSEDAAIPIEVIAPEVELAPPAEPPGPGDPEDRLAESDASNSSEPKNPDKPA